MRNGASRPTTPPRHEPWPKNWAASPWPWSRPAPTLPQRSLGFAHYLAEWQSQRDKVLAWFDPRLMQYPKAVTWQTSFDQLGGPARRLLQRLAWLAPEPIPESLMEVPVFSDN
jgi:hypothetical protein